MGKKWDYDVPSVEIWAECLRVLKPGGHLLAFGGSRTYHRLTVGVEDAGFEIRDQIMWVYGSGFPKSMDVSKAIDKAAAAEREVVGLMPDRWTGKGNVLNFSTDAAQQWQGWGTALKPSHEPIVVARKPLIGTVVANVMAHGTGGINIDGCRVAVTTDDNIHAKNPNTKGGFGHAGASVYGDSSGAPAYDPSSGRWPANLIHDGSDEVLALFPANAGATAQVKGTESSAASSGNVTGKRARVPGEFHADKGSAARFFYCAKTSKRDRNEGLDDLPDAILARSCQAQAEAVRGNTVEEAGGAFNKARVTKNNHPTVKPTELMAYLCRLVTPPGGVVLDPFMGSGSTGKAAMREGFNFIGCEISPEYVEIARARIGAVSPSSLDTWLDPLI